MLHIDKDFLEKEKKKLCIQGDEGNTSRIFQFVPCNMPNLSWNCHENLFISFSQHILQKLRHIVL